MRSTQCAALIALATAAGIARVEPAERGTASSPSASQGTELTTNDYHRSLRHFEVTQTFASWFHVIRLATELSAEMTSTETLRLPLELNGIPPPFAETGVTDLATIPHALPFSVGPPGRGTNTLVLAVVRRLFQPHICALERVGNPVQTCTAWFPKPSPALRGGLARFPSFHPIADPIGSFAVGLIRALRIFGT